MSDPYEDDYQVRSTSRPSTIRREARPRVITVSTSRLVSRPDFSADDYQSESDDYEDDYQPKVKSRPDFSTDEDEEEDDYEDEVRVINAEVRVIYADEKTFQSHVNITDAGEVIMSRRLHRDVYQSFNNFDTIGDYIILRDLPPALKVIKYNNQNFESGLIILTQQYRIIVVNEHHPQGHPILTSDDRNPPLIKELIISPFNNNHHVIDIDDNLYRLDYEGADVILSERYIPNVRMASISGNSYTLNVINTHNELMMYKLSRLDDRPLVIQLDFTPQLIIIDSTIIIDTEGNVYEITGIRDGQPRVDYIKTLDYQFLQWATGSVFDLHLHTIDREGVWRIHGIDKRRKNIDITHSGHYIKFYQSYYYSLIQNEAGEWIMTDNNRILRIPFNLLDSQELMRSRNSYPMVKSARFMAYG